MRILAGGLAWLCCAVIATAVPADASDLVVGTAAMQTADGKDAGSATVTAVPNGLLVSGDFKNLPAGELAFLIHETGQCTPDFEAAGEHLNPEGHEHGFFNPEGYHAGDLPNITVASDGTATAEMFNTEIDADDASDLFDDDGAALIVHTIADTYEGDADFGDRVACGASKPTGQ
ncbi:MAG: superoxide dismutase family protein [Rhodospirillaceae bacterium]|nr:superoxide dismutase family protein [Rhodospirillaceae bacterium]